MAIVGCTTIMVLIAIQGSIASRLQRHSVASTIHKRQSSSGTPSVLSSLSPSLQSKLQEASAKSGIPSDQLATFLQKTKTLGYTPQQVSQMAQVQGLTITPDEVQQIQNGVPSSVPAAPPVSSAVQPLPPLPGTPSLDQTNSMPLSIGGNPISVPSAVVPVANPVSPVGQVNPFALLRQNTAPRQPVAAPVQTLPSQFQTFNPSAPPEQWVAVPPVAPAVKPPSKGIQVAKSIAELPTLEPVFILPLTTPAPNKTANGTSGTQPALAAAPVAAPVAPVAAPTASQASSSTNTTSVAASSNVPAPAPAATTTAAPTPAPVYFDFAQMPKKAASNLTNQTGPPKPTPIPYDNPVLPYNPFAQSNHSDVKLVPNRPFDLITTTRAPSTTTVTVPFIGYSVGLLAAWAGKPVMDIVKEASPSKKPDTATNPPLNILPSGLSGKHRLGDIMTDPPPPTTVATTLAAPAAVTVTKPQAAPTPAPNGQSQATESSKLTALSKQANIPASQLLDMLKQAKQAGLTDEQIANVGKTNGISITPQDVHDLLASTPNSAPAALQNVVPSVQQLPGLAIPNPQSANDKPQVQTLSVPKSSK